MVALSIVKSLRIVNQCLFFIDHKLHPLPQFCITPDNQLHIFFFYFRAFKKTNTEAIRNVCLTQQSEN